ncbi:MAG: hypothetical protein ACFFG0_23905 [Candidatus Thorarchaeota archaeon]
MIKYSTSELENSKGLKLITALKSFGNTCSYLVDLHLARDVPGGP